MPGPSDQEQLFLEYINETRLDPLANAARYITSYSPLTSSNGSIQSAINFFQVSGTALQAAYNALVAVGPVAWNEALSTAAEGHNAAMIAAQLQTHQAPGEASLGTRLTNAGYTFQSAGENVFAYTESVIQGHAGFMIDWGNGPNGMQSPAGHRNNIMNANFTEVGIAMDAEPSPANPLGPYVVTQDFGTRGKLFVLGVAYSDNDNNNFYSIGEGRADLTVQVAARNATSTSSGGYTVEAASGAATITLTGGGLASAVTVLTTIAGENIKLDVVDGTVLLASRSVSVSGPITELRGLGVRGLSLTTGAGDQLIVGTRGGDTLDGGAGNDNLTGGLGNDSLIGGSNVDTAFVSGNRAAYTVTQTSTGVFSVVGPDGTDTLVDMEFLQFADQLLRLLPGSGTAVNFTADPDTYMAAIRDFGGNNLGGGDSWQRIGAADVDGDGDIDQFFVNAAIGRFAEVATGPDGLVYFSDYGWAGETRVVGIYIDPLVASGQVVAGGPFDSQTRFQNDLLIENINGVLGGADYDHDGLQEVYFKLTDGTAYLHAYMHADGNIRYANYQSQQQVIDYLTAEGWAPATWAGWFPANADGHQAAKTAPVFDPVDSFAFAREDFAGWTAELQSEPIYG